MCGAYYRLLNECCLLIVIKALSSTRETFMCTDLATCSSEQVLHFEIHLNSPQVIPSVNNGHLVVDNIFFVHFFPLG